MPKQDAAFVLHKVDDARVEVYSSDVAAKSSSKKNELGPDEYVSLTRPFLGEPVEERMDRVRLQIREAGSRLLARSAPSERRGAHLTSSRWPFLPAFALPETLPQRRS